MRRSDSMMYTEMVNATGLHYVKELPKIMEVDPPISIQLFDCRPDFLAEAAQMAVEEGADTVDINMGCPVNKITKMAVGLLYCVNQKQLRRSCVQW